MRELRITCGGGRGGGGGGGGGRGRGRGRGGRVGARGNLQTSQLQLRALVPSAHRRW